MEMQQFITIKMKKLLKTLKKPLSKKLLIQKVMIFLIQTQKPMKKQLSNVI